jgi:hypothetical protein
MSWGIHRLQICSNWIHRTKVMNFMVFISHFCYFIFIPKICAEPLWFLCIDGFYTFVEFHRYQVCKIWPSGLFYMDFANSGHIQWFEIWIWIRVWLNLTGADYAGNVAVPDWPIPIRYCLLILGAGFGSEGQRRIEGNCSPAGPTPAMRGTDGRRLGRSGGCDGGENSGRGAEEDGGLVGLISDGEGFPRRARDATGVRRGCRALRRVIYSVILRGKVPLDVVRMYARGWGKYQGKRASTEASTEPESNDDRRWSPRASALVVVIPAVILPVIGEERVERGVGTWEGSAEGLREKGGSGDGSSGSTFPEKKRGRGLGKKNMTGGPGVAVGEREREGCGPYLLGWFGGCWLWAGPVGLLLFFYSNSFSYFLFSCFVSLICLRHFYLVLVQL